MDSPFGGNVDGTQLWLGGGTVVAAIATTGSLWFSLGLGLVPCDLCWYQRILMYPLVLVLGVATLESRVGVWRTALPLAALGGGLAAYHSYLQVTAETCSLGGACAAIQWQAPVVGMTIPNLSLVGFLFVIVAVLGAVDVSRSEA
jgi:disulfide bond formation protein DsbB